MYGTHRAIVKGALARTPELINRSGLDVVEITRSRTPRRPH